MQNKWRLQFQFGQDKSQKVCLETEDLDDWRPRECNVKALQWIEEKR